MNKTILFSKLSEFRFEVTFNYNPELVSIIKSFDGRKFNPERKTLSLPNQHYKACIEKIKESKNLNVIGMKSELLQEEKLFVEITVNGEKIFIKCPYKEILVNQIKLLPGKFWNNEKESWIVDKKFSDHLEKFMIKNEINFSFKKKD